MSTKRSRDASFMSRPEDGWLHDDRGLAAGMGVFVSFPISYVGTVVMRESLQKMEEEDQAGIIREAIARSQDAVTVAAGKKVKGKRTLAKGIRDYPFGEVLPLSIDVFLSISVTGLLISPCTDPDLKPAEFDPADTGIINFHSMKVISMAAGGEDDDFDLIAYIAKDRETDERHAHVFNCGDLSDQVLTTIGQAFTLAQKASDARRAARAAAGTEPIYERSQYGAATDMFEPPVPVPALTEAQKAVYFDPAPYQKPQIYLDVSPMPTVPEDDIEGELRKLQINQKIYATIDSVEEDAQAQRLVGTLNRKSRMGLEGAGATAQPSWTYFKPTADIKKVDPRSLKPRYA